MEIEGRLKRKVSRIRRPVDADAEGMKKGKRFPFQGFARGRKKRRVGKREKKRYRVKIQLGFPLKKGNPGKNIPPGERDLPCKKAHNAARPR